MDEKTPTKKPRPDMRTRAYWEESREKVEERNEILKKPGPGNRPWPKIYERHEDDFFTRTASRVSYLNKEIVQEVYGEILRTLMADIRINKFAFLPNFGKFRVLIRKGRLYENKYRKKKVPPYLTPDHYWMRFKPDLKVKAYVKSLKKRDDIMEAKQKKI